MLEQERKFIIYGAGQRGETALKVLGKERTTVFVDAFKKGTIECIPIIRPDSLLDYYGKDTIIVVTPKETRRVIEIVLKLKDMGISDYALFDEVIKTDTRKSIVSDNTLINIGSGDWECDGWTNLDYSSEWYSTAHEGRNYIEYDIRNDDIPYDDNSVDCIYCSHVIEHIEDIYDQKMFRESYRVLKKGGIIRIACPDAEFLWNMTKQGKDWWVWRKRWCERFGANWDELRPVDFLVREVATPRMKGIGYLDGTSEGICDYNNIFDTMNSNEFFAYITDGLVFNAEHVGDHINFWTYEKLSQELRDAGFSGIFKSKYAGSLSPFMKSREYFDLKEPGMSLYVEAIK